jgi:thiamine biosynthesis protein ThiI
MSSSVESAFPSSTTAEGGAVVVHYSEIGLKGNNRGFFVNTLASNIRDALRGLPVGAVKPMYGRLMIHLREAADGPAREEIRQRLRFVPGIANFSVARAIPLGRTLVEPIERDPVWAALLERAWEVVRDSGATSFAMRVKRPEKQFPIPSLEMERRVGGEVMRRAIDAGRPLRVDLDSPAITCRIEILRPYSFVYGQREQGPGGLPVGSSGRLVSLLSAGFDSPVASFLMMKRGAECVYVHFYGYPLTDASSADHARDIVEVLGRAQPRSTLYLVPFGLAQQEIISASPRDLRMVIYRRLMMRIASEVARREKALGLVTGESLGQVASQTLNNLAVIDQAAELPVYRPLIGMNKDEIIALSARIGTHDISAEPTPDCCSLMVSKHPVTRAEMRMIEPVEARVDMARLVDEALERADIRRA